MNLAYFRKSTYSFEETVNKLKDVINQKGLKLLDETDLPGGNKVLHVCNSKWLGNLIASDPTLIGLLPCSIVVVNKDGAINVGVGSPAILGGVSHNPGILKLSQEAEDVLKQIVNESAGVGDLKPTKIKLYSTTTCPYCNMEKSWLESNKIAHEIIYVDRDQQQAQAMVEKTGQMGVPVTEVQYEEGDPEYIVGFDKHKLASILGIRG